MSTHYRQGLEHKFPASHEDVFGVYKAMIRWFGKHELAQIDPLKSDGDKLEKVLTAAWVELKHKIYDGVPRGLFGMAAVVDKAKEDQQIEAAELQAALSMNAPLPF